MFQPLPGEMVRNVALASGDQMQSGPSDSGPFFHGGHTFRPARPPPFWGPVPRLPFQGYGPRPFPFPPIPPFAYGPPVFSVPPPSLPPSSSSKTEDEAWLNNWINSRSFQQSSRSSAVHTLPIFKAKEKLQQCVSMLNGLKEMHSNLQKKVTCLPENEWMVAWSNAEEKRVETSDFINTALNDKALTDLKKRLKMRIAKRTRQKSQHAKLKKDAYLTQLRRQNLHKQADAWLSDMQLTVERARKDDELKKEADTVLAEVTRRQTDGRRQIALVESLQKLHQARIQTLQGRGTKLTVEEQKNCDHSALVFDRLLAMWSSKMEEYAKEENGLRLMLEESAARKSDMELKNVQRVLNEWEKCLFGSESVSLKDDSFDINTLVSIRYAWDQYVVPDGVSIPMASTIPVGWVLPTTPSSPEWQKLQSSH